jgi:hypothetical protein
MALLTRHDRTARALTVLSLRRTVLAVLVMAASMGARAAAVERQVASTDEVKAAFLLNFAKFVEWPPDPATRSGRRCSA